MQLLTRSAANDPHAPRYFNAVVVALVATTAAGLLRWSLDPLLGNRVAFATFFIAVVFSVRFGGLASALLTMVLAVAWAILMWFPEGPLSHVTLGSSAVFVASSLAIVALGRKMHFAEALAKGRSHELQSTVHGLRASQGRLQLATEISGLGVFEWDVAANRFTGENPEAYRIFGRQPGDEKLTLETFTERHLHPDDAARVRVALDEAMRPGERFHVVFRLRRLPDAWRWVEIAGLFLHEGAQPTHLIGVIADITERKELEDSLRKMAHDLSEADQRKDEFLATLAHELRNPLAPIRNGIELLKRQEQGNAEALAVVGVMERQMKHMVRLVDDLIDVSRITRDKLELRRQLLDLGQVLRTAIEACQPLIESKGHHLALTLPPVQVALEADATRLVQVFSNLLNNAVKYTEPGGHLGISAERHGAEVVVVVTDDGSGIPTAMLPRVFEMFTQLDRTLERSQGGLGIGLSMVKRLVEMHGGSISLHSDGVGRGTRVEVRLPAALTPPPPPWAGADAHVHPMISRRVVVADDNRDAAESLGKVLELMGHEVRVAFDGVEAVEAVTAFDPDLVMLDIGMPVMTGHEACRRIRELPDRRDRVIIAVTGWGQDEDRLRSQEAGFDLHLTKPLDPAALEAVIAGLAPPKGETHTATRPG
jgi:PAS domain S-box-containing protein